MKKLIMAICLVSSAVTIADTNNVVRTRRRPSRPSAGILERRELLPSKQIGVKNNQKIVTETCVNDSVLKARMTTSLPLVSGNGTSVAEIELIERNDASVLTLMPEEFKATINVSALATDSATPDVIALRLQKEMSRAGLFLMGSGCSRGDITKPIRGLKELDALQLFPPHPETLMHLNAKGIAGVQLIRFASYDQACREGWAPAPTNDVQKAIWDEVHAIPTEPIKIKPETHPAK